MSRQIATVEMFIWDVHADAADADAAGADAHADAADNDDDDDDDDDDDNSWRRRLMKTIGFFAQTLYDICTRLS